MSREDNFTKEELKFRNKMGKIEAIQEGLAILKTLPNIESTEEKTELIKLMMEEIKSWKTGGK